jgi:hypoxanthine-guanine phosphoribosyltransferase
MTLGRTVISAQELEARIGGLAAEIDRSQGGRPLVLVGFMKWSFLLL